MTLELLLQYVLLVVMFVIYIITIEMKDLLYAVILLGGGDIVLSVLFYMLQAPDIAITQAVVNAGVAIVLFVVAISRTGRME